MTTETGSPADWYFEDFEVGQVFRTHGRTITEADIVSFAGWSWDTNPMHTDVELARDGRFGQSIAHGVRATSNGQTGILEREFVLTNQDGTIVQQGAIGLMVSRRPVD